MRHAAELAVCDDPGLWVDGPSGRRYVTGAAHSDSGFLTLLAQDGVSGLQARWGGADWVDVPPADDGLVVNFGQVLEQWCAGRIRATQHRVVGNGRERHSVPFFYEARADALISPLPLDSVEADHPVRRVSRHAGTAQAAGSDRIEVGGTPSDSQLRYSDDRQKRNAMRSNESVSATLSGSRHPIVIGRDASDSVEVPGVQQFLKRQYRRCAGTIKRPM